MRKYEIVVLSKGAYARTLKIYAKGKADRAVIFCGGKSIDAAVEAVKSVGGRIAAVTVEGTPAPYGYLPFDTAENNKDGCDGKAFCEFLLTAVIPYLDKRFGFELYSLVGSGAAGIAAFYAATQKHERIKSYAALSAPFFIGGDRLLPTLRDAGLSDGSYYVHADCEIPDIDAATQNAFVTSAASAYAFLRAQAKPAKLRIDNDTDAAVREFISDFSDI